MTISKEYYESAISSSQSGKQTVLYLIGPSAFILPVLSSASTSTEIKSYDRYINVYASVRRKFLKIIELPVSKTLG